MIKKIRPIDIKNVLSENDAEAKNEELLQKEIAEFDRIAEVLKQREKEKALAGGSEENSRVESDNALEGETAGAEANGDAEKESTGAEADGAGSEYPETLEDDVKAEIAKHVRAREAAMKAQKKAPAMPARPALEKELQTLRVKHVLDLVEEEDGTRLLVERVWPKDLNRKTYPMTDWQPAVGPTLALRKELAEAQEKLSGGASDAATVVSSEADPFAAFAVGYKAYLSKDPAALEFKAEIRTILQVENVTFLHASDDPDRNSAVVLREWVLE